MDKAEEVAREIVREVDRDWDLFDNITDDMPEREWPPSAIQLITVFAAALRAFPSWNYDMEKAPIGEAVEVEMTRYAHGRSRPVGTWVATAVFHPKPAEDHRTNGGCSILHYNGDVLVPNFHGPIRRWRPLPPLPRKEGD